MVRTLLCSKKFTATYASVIVGFAAKKGPALQTEEVLAVLSPAMAYILGQGVADFGKEKPVERNETKTDNDKSTSLSESETQQ